MQILVIFFNLLVFVLVKVFYFPVYEAVTVIMVDVKKSPTSIETERVDLRENIGYIRVHTELLKSEPVLRSTVDELKLYEDRYYRKNIKNKGQTITDISQEKSTRRIIDLLRKNYISINSPLFTNLIEIKVQYKNAEKAAQIVNVLIKNYIDWSINFLHREVDRILDYLDNEVKNSSERLSKSEDALWKFKEENKILSLPEEIKTYIQRQAKFESEYISTGVQEKELSMRIEVIRQELAAGNKAGISELSTISHPFIQAIEAQLLSLEIELSRLMELYTEDSPQVIYMQKRISVLKDKLKSTVEKIFASEISISTVNPVYQNLINDLIQSETMLIALGAKKEAIFKILKDYADKLKDIPKKEVELARLMRDVKINEDLHTFLVQEQENARLLKVKQTTENIKIVSPALVPIKPKGRLANLLFGSIISLIFAISFPIFFAYRKKSFLKN